MKHALWVALLSALFCVGTCGDLLADASGAAFEASRHSLEHELPTYWECETCLDCVPTAEGSAGPPAAKTSWGVLPACSRCTGCTHDLELLNLSARVWLHSGDVRVIPMQPGNTGASIFRAVDAAGASHVLKVHGVLSAMVEPAKMERQNRLYGGMQWLPRELLLSRSLSRIADDCGLGAVTVHEHVVEDVRAFVPGTGVKLDLPRAVFAEYAEGASAELLMGNLTSDELLAALQSVPHSSLRDAALLDLLFAQGDRHGDNVLLDGAGGLKLIDSRDAALDLIGFDSLFLPSTLSFQRNLNRAPLRMLDYRCHVPDGAIGTAYPPAMARCLRELAAMMPADFVSKYMDQAIGDAVATRDDALKALNDRPLLLARLVTQQARNMHELGFEEALLRTKHKNSSGIVPFVSGFPIPPPCCSVVALGRKMYACAAAGPEEGRAPTAAAAAAAGKGAREGAPSEGLMPPEASARHERVMLLRKRMRDARKNGKYFSLARLEEVSSDGFE